MENIYTLIITAITTLAGVKAWRYFEKRATHKEDDERYIRNDCQSRISKLELLLEQASEEKDEMRAQILKLVEEVSALRVEIKYLMENGKSKGL
jgi:predicted negative regulator of RcsB-dependent stress response